MGQAYGCRPSAILGIEDQWLAYQVDLACLVSRAEPEQAKPKLRDASELRRRGPLRKVRIPESGIW